MENHYLQFQDLVSLSLQYLKQSDHSCSISTKDRDLFEASKSLPKERAKLHALPIPIAPPQKKPVFKQEEKKTVLPSEKQETPPLVKTETQVSSSSFATISDILKKMAPEIAILPDVPKDEEAKAIKAFWKQKSHHAPICILLVENSKEAAEFANNLANAIASSFGPTKVVTLAEIQSSKLVMEGCKVLLGNEAGILQSALLRSSYRKVVNKKEYFLFDLPILLMHPPSYYQAYPQQKASLWKELCQTLPHFLSHP